jgi:NAD(P)-dependent dehydrogenase (short-subunit alcohol dehydrogenase family)
MFGRFTKGDVNMRILITGITGNLGKAAWNVFSDAGWQISGLSREKSISHSGWATCVDSGVNLSYWQEVETFIDHAEPFDLVFMTHGTQQKVMIPDFTQTAWERVVDNNLKSAAILSSALLKCGRLEPGCLVVYCSSIQATQPRAGRGLYAVAKGGLESLARTMAVELAPDGRAIALRLGQMAETMKGISFTPEDAEAIKGFTPLPWVNFENTARLVLNLYSQPSISGVIYDIDSLHHLSIWPQ